MAEDKGQGIEFSLRRWWTFGHHLKWVFLTFYLLMVGVFCFSVFRGPAQLLATASPDVGFWSMHFQKIQKIFFVIFSGIAIAQFWWKKPPPNPKFHGFVNRWCYVIRACEKELQIGVRNAKTGETVWEEVHTAQEDGLHYHFYSKNYATRFRKGRPPENFKAQLVPFLTDSWD